MSELIRVEDVFGIRAQPVLSYVSRPQVDGAFEAALKSDHHIVIYGSSKQGKTALRQKHLSEQMECIVRPGPRTTIEDVYAPILRAANVRLETFQTSKTESGTSARAKTGFKAFIPWIGGADVGFEADSRSGKQDELRTEFIGHDLGEAQSIGELLGRTKFRKFVVLENFHYLPTDTQKQLAYDLKTFHELGVRFIILGVWRESNRLVQFNRDLEDRIIEIPVEPWIDDDLARVSAVGCEKLGIQIGPRAIERFRENAFGNVGMFQEFLKTFCLRCGVAEAQRDQRLLDDMNAVEDTFAARLENQRKTLLDALVGIAARSRTRNDTDDPLILPYYLVRVILRVGVESLREGIKKKALLEELRKVHHRQDKATIRMSDVTNLITRLPALQQDLQPPLLYFDGNSRSLKLVDTRQFFVLANIDRSEMEEEIASPVEEE